MKITKSTRMDDFFAEELGRLVKKAQTDTGEKQLADQREEDGLGTDVGTEEVLLDKDRKNDGVVEVEIIETKLENRKARHAPNEAKSGSGLVEGRLDAADHALYPHRNPEAWERTGEKRPVNMLDGENPSGAGEGDRLERWEKASGKSQNGPKRQVDKDVGEQKEMPYRAKDVKEAFNMHRTKVARDRKAKQGAIDAVAMYLAYRDGGDLISMAAKEAKRTDAEMASIMDAAAKAQRLLNGAEMEKVAALKRRKTEILGVKTDAIQS